MTFGTIFFSEFLGTGLLMLLGSGVVANVVLPKTGGNGGGWLLINWGWGVAVFAGVYVAWRSGAHLNPAVTIGLLAAGNDLGGAANVLAYLAGQFVGAFFGSSLAWVAYRSHFDDADAEAGLKRAVFCTAPAIRNLPNNLATEAIGTFVLVFVVIAFGQTPSGLGPLAVALLVVGIGASLGGPTGYAINPARDLAPRLAHAVLPIPGKGPGGWDYAWVPVVGPLAGGAVAGLLAAGVGMV